MSCHQVQADLYASFVGFVDQRHHIGIRTEARVNLVEVDDIVATVKPSRLEYGIQPQGIHAQRLDVIQPAGDAGQVSDTVPVRIHVRGRIDLIENGIVKPLWVRTDLGRYGDCHGQCRCCCDDFFLHCLSF